MWRPFVKFFFYSEKILSDRLTENHFEMFGDNLLHPNQIILLTNHTQIPFVVHAADKITDAGYGSRATQCLPLYRYDANGNRSDNITDWGRAQFVEHYGDESITKEDIFHYVHAVLHHPAYRSKYELNLKREFPRIPTYLDFFQWAAWGKALMASHIDYETVAPFALVRRDAMPKVKVVATLLFSETNCPSPKPNRSRNRRNPGSKLTNSRAKSR